MFAACSKALDKVFSDLQLAQALMPLPAGRPLHEQPIASLQFN